MSQKCLECAHWDLRGSPDMARLGFGHCRKTLLGIYSSQIALCNCGQFMPVSNEQQQKRINFLNRKGTV